MSNNLKQSTLTHDLNDWVQWREIPKINPQFRHSSVDWAVKQRHNNGLAPYCRKFGRHVMVSLSGFEKWMAEKH